MKDNSSSEDDKLKLWTTQKKIVVDTIKQNGVYYVKKEFIEQKYKQVSDVFLEAYNWYINQAKKIVPRPPLAEYPIWLTTDPLYLDHSGQGQVLEIEVDQEKAIVFDKAKWNRILNLSYLPKNDADEKKHLKELEKYNLTDDSEAYLSNHYPYLKSKIKNSWERLFDASISLSEAKQATLWQLKEEWVVNI